MTVPRPVVARAVGCVCSSEEPRWETEPITTPDPLPALGWSPTWADRAEDAAARNERPGAEPGRVIRHDGVAVLVATRDGTVARPVLATVDPQPVVGDWVLTTDETVVAVLERSSLLRRRDTRRDTEQHLVANVDTVIIVCGLDRPVRDGRIQRATAVAWDADAEPVVVLTKADLVDDAEETADAVRGANPGVEVLVTSSKDEDGLQAVRDLGIGKSVVMLGESGAGKSSLTNALSDGDVAVVGAVREGDAKGRHTTTSRELHVLPSGGVLIDTPGVRSLGLWTDAESVVATFDDIESLAEGCRFNDCAHDAEPGCAVQAAIEAGDIHPARLEAWHAFHAEVADADRRADEKAWRTPEAPPESKRRRKRGRGR